MHMVKKSLNLISNLILVERERERERERLFRAWLCGRLGG